MVSLIGLLGFIEGLEMKEFHIGQKVVVSDTGDNYTTYDEMAKKMNLSNWNYNNGCPIGDELTIVAKGEHEDYLETIYGLRDKNGDEYLAGGKYFSLVKPTRIKVEYARIVDSLWNLKDYFEKCELYMPVDSECFKQITKDNELAEHFVSESIHRRIETTTTERDEFIEKVGDVLPIFDKRTNPMWAGRLYDAGFRFVGE